MIRLALFLLFYMIPGLILGYMILAIFPHIPRELFIIVNMGLIVGGVLKYKDKKQRDLAAEDRLEEMPGWLKSKSLLIFLGIGTLLASFVMFSFNKTELYIDNASDKDIVIKVSHEGSFTVKAGRYEELSVVKGDIEFEYNNRKKKFDITGEGQWILNIDKHNSYIRTSVSYSNYADLYKNNKSIPEETLPGYKIIKDEFFNADVDYVFEVPEKISVKASEITNEVTKTALYRMNGIDMSSEHVSDGAIRFDSTGHE